MNDLGTDSGSTALNLSTKVIEALLKLFEKIYDTWQKFPERALQKYKMQKAKDEISRQEAMKKIDGKTGYINHKALSKTGEPLTVCGINLTKEEIKQFNSVCKREGVLFSTVSNQQLKKDGEKAFLAIECRTSDLEKLRAAVDRFNDEKRIMAIDSRIESILSKGEENLTEQDFVDLRELTNQKEAAQRMYCESLNERMQESVIQNAFDESSLNPVSISEALNRNTGRSIDKDQYTIIADANDPSKVIKCHGYDDVDPQGETYIKTDYEVYHGDKCILKTDDGRFEGRTNDYWMKQKQSIESAAGFSGTYYKFYTEAEYERWAEHVKTQNRTELYEMEKPVETKDFIKCRESAYEKLEENGAEIRNGVVFDKESGKALQDMISDKSLNMSPEQKALAAESVTVGKQIQNYDTIAELKNQLDLARAELIITREGTKENALAKVKVDDIEEKISAAYEQESMLVNERKNINAVQSVQETRGDKEESIENPRQEYPDARRTERVDEHDERQMTMEEAKGEIEEARAKNGAKGADVKDRGVAKETQIKVPKRPDRTD